MAFPPEAFLIGAQKAGTTYLAALLDQHPEIRVARPKEPHFFTGNWERGLDWYRSCFPDTSGAEILLDASPSYTAAPLHESEILTQGQSASPAAGVPERIRDLAPNARFIYLLRDPVARVHSAYWHAVRIGDERRPLREALAADPRYTNMSDYLGQARLYLRVFPPERLLFLRFEDLRADPVAVAERCARFLGASGEAAIDPDRGHHSGYRPGGAMRVLLAARRLPGVDALQEGLWRVLPPGVRRLVRSGMTQPVPPLEAADRAFLEERFAPMVGPLEELAGLDLSPWGLGGGAGLANREGGMAGSREG